MANMPFFHLIYRSAGVRPQAAASRMDALSHALHSLSHGRQVAPCANSRHTTPRDKTPQSRGAISPEFCKFVCLSENRGRRESRVPTAPAASCVTR